MSIHRQARPRARRRSLRIELDHDPFHIWLPAADDPVVIAGFGDAASFAFEVADWQVEREVLVLLDARRRVTAMLLDPLARASNFAAAAVAPATSAAFSCS